MTTATLRIYHNPRCTKSRQALALLEERGVPVEVIHYLETPPDAGELRRILALLHYTPRELLRRGESAYRENGLNNKDLGDDALLAVMVANPILIQRPVVIAANRALIARPPERVLELI